MKKLAALLLALILSLSAVSALAQAVPADEITMEDAMGVIDGDLYTNSYLGIGFRLPAGQGWRYYTEEEIALTNEIALALVDGDLKDMLEQTQNITLMSATTEEGFPNVGIQIADLGDSLSLVQMLGFEFILSLQADALKETLENGGMKDVEIKVGTLVIDGEEVTGLWTRYTYWGFTVYSVEACLIRGDYAVYITATAEEEGVADTVFDNVFWIN